LSVIGINRNFLSGLEKYKKIFFIFMELFL